MTSNCISCIHNKVCRFKNVCEKICKKFNDCRDIIIDENESFEIGQFEVEIKCKDFELALPKAREINDDELSFNGKGLKISGESNPCADCDWFKTYVLGGKIYVGDSPCNWCDKKYPSCLRVASTTSTSSGGKIND